MDATSAWLAKFLMSRIRDRREELLPPLIAGKSVDYADYRDRTAYLRALMDLESWIEEARLDADERRKIA